jgi:hypothetical protein
MRPFLTQLPRYCLLLCLPALAVSQQMETTRATEGAPPKPAVRISKEARDLSSRLLDRAYGLSAQVSDADKAFLLARIAEVTAKSDPELSLSRAGEALQIASELASGPARSRIFMSAISALSENDIDRALQALQQLAPPPAASDAINQPPPDLRSMLAIPLFQKAWQKHGLDSLDQLQATARQLGETGAYPFVAMGMLVRRVDQKDPARAQALIQDGVTFAGRGIHSQIEASQVAMFLSNASEFVSPALMKEILERLVAQARATGENAAFSLAITDSAGKETARLSGASVLIMNLLPLIRRVDAEWASRLEKESDDLRTFIAARRGQQEGGQRMSVGVMIGGPGGPNAPRRDMREEMTAMQVDELAQRDPTRALQVSSAINDPVLRAASTASLAGSFSRSDPARAAELLKSARQVLAETPEPRDKLTILIGLAKAQSALGDAEGFKDTLARSFALAEDLYRKGLDRDPSAPVFAQPGFDQLSRLITAAAEKDVQSLQVRIEALRSTPLQASMWIQLAQALDPERRHLGPGLRIAIED